MSVKIYNGHKFKTTSLKEINDFCSILREKYLALLKEEIIGKIKNKNLWSLGYNSYLDNTHTQYFNYADLHICFFPIKNYTLFVPFGIDEPFSEINNKITFYGYWDNTDPDDTCSKYMWEKRENDWEEVLTQYPSANYRQHGYTKQITDRLDLGSFLYDDDLWIDIKYGL